MINFSEGEPAFINGDIISQFNLKNGMQIHKSAWEEIVYANDFSKSR